MAEYEQLLVENPIWNSRLRGVGIFDADTAIEHGVTGLLVDTTSQDALAEAVVTALDLAVAPGAAARAEHARTMVAERFGIGTMAASLVGIYDRVHREAPS